MEEYILYPKSVVQTHMDKIREKTGKSDSMTLSQATIELDQFTSNEIVTEPNLQEKTVTENSIVVPDEGYDGLSKVIVNVPYTDDNLLEYTEITIPVKNEDGQSLWEGTSYAYEDYYNSVAYNKEYSVVLSLPRKLSSTVNSMEIVKSGIYLARINQGSVIDTTVDKNSYTYKWDFDFVAMKVPERDIVVGVSIYEK